MQQTTNYNLNLIENSDEIISSIDGINNNFKIIDENLGKSGGGGGSDTPTYEQLVNYTMLYDGSLGDATENQCVDITGGYSKQINSDYIEDTVIFNDNNIYCKAKRLANTPKNYLARISTNSLINLNGYKKIGVLAKITLELYDYSRSSLELATAKIGNVALFKFGDYTVVQENSANGIKHIYSGDISELETKNVYFCAQAFSMNSTVTNNLSEVEMYYAFLVKNDDWKTLASKADITASSIDDILINSETLLSNKDAVEFMIYQCTGDFMASAIQSNTFLTALNNSEFKTIILANKHWNKFLNMVA